MCNRQLDLIGVGEVKVVDRKGCDGQAVWGFGKDVSDGVDLLGN